MNFNPYALSVDIVLIVVFVWTVYRAWKRGFVDAVAGLISVIGAVIVSRMFGFVLRDILKQKVFEPLIGKTVAAAIENAIAGAGETADAASDAVSAGD